MIDMHVHIGNMHSVNCKIDFEEAIEIANKMGVEKIFCTHLLSLYYNYEEGNAAILKGMRKYPDRILGYITITTPRQGEHMMDHIKRYLYDYGFHGIKIYSHSKGMISYEPWLSITDPYMYPIYELACDCHVPVLAHSTPDECNKICEDFPGLLLIMAHMGATALAGGDWHKAITTAQKHNNLFLDTTSSGMDLGMVEEAVKLIGAERVVWGSDMPLLDPWYEVEKIKSSEISDHCKELILGENIKRLVNGRFK